jgi:ribonuclease P protein component
VLLVHPRSDERDTVRIGYTVTKKIGGAVVRNRLKRRLRAAAADVVPASAPAGSDVVLIGRQGGLTAEFTALKRDLERAFVRAARKGHAPRTDQAGRAGRRQKTTSS